MMGKFKMRRTSYVPMPKAALSNLAKRKARPLSQSAIVSVVVFCCVGLTAAVSGLGAGGSHPRNIPIVDRVNATLCGCMVVSGLVSGSLINKLGPRLCLVIAAAGYPVYTGGLWWLDSGRAVGFTYFCGVFHGITAGLFYSTATYIVGCYSTEQVRGAYVSSIWIAFALGSAVGSAAVLAIAVHSSMSRSHVPPAVYATVIGIQSFGTFVACFLNDPTTIRRRDGRAIAYFPTQSWVEELRSLLREAMAAKALIPALAFAVCQTPNGLYASVNAFYFNARTRALASVGYWSTTAIGSLIAGICCDSQRLGHRHRRSLVAGAVVVLIISGVWSGIIFLLITYDVDRYRSPLHMDWTDRPLSKSVSPLVILALSGLVPGVMTAYVQWLASSYSNSPLVVARLMGYVEALRGLGLALMYAIDSHKVAYRTEGIFLFSWLMAGAVSCLVAALLYVSDTEYGNEVDVIVPDIFIHRRGIFEKNDPATERDGPDVEGSGNEIATHGVVLDEKRGVIRDL